MTSRSMKVQVGRRIRARRVSRGLSQGQVGVRTGLNPSYVSRLESGKVNPTMRTLAAIAGALHMQVSELIGSPRGAPASLPCPVSSTRRCLCELMEQSPRRAAADDEAFTPAQIALLRDFASLVRAGDPPTIAALRTLLLRLQRSLTRG